MVDPPAYPDSGEDPERTSGTPRWVKLFGVIALVVVVLFAILLLSGRGGDHGPRRHTQPVGIGGHPPPAGVSEPAGVGGQEPPAGRHTRP